LRLLVSVLWVLVVDHDAYFEPESDPDAEFARWLNDFVRLRGRFERALDLRNGDFNKRYEALNALARELNFNPDNLERPALLVLDAMLQPLGDALAAGSKSFVEDVESDLHTRVCRTATAVLSLDTIDAAIRDFQFGKIRLERMEARDMPRELRAMLAKQLSVRLLKAMNEWHKYA
jgi:hypothetical protein